MAPNNIRFQLTIHMNLLGFSLIAYCSPVSLLTNDIYLSMKFSKAYTYIKHILREQLGMAINLILHNHYPRL